VVERWNHDLASGRDVWSSPTIHAAIVADLPWLDVFCPGCKTSRVIDIRTIDRHPLASVGSLVLGLPCSWCSGSAPMPVITGLHACPPAAADRQHLNVALIDNGVRILPPLIEAKPKR
jgi:hypothetical protein